MSNEEIFLNTFRDWIETSTHRSIHAFIRHNRESALSLSQVNTLFLLYHHGPSSVNDLADYLGITKAAVSQLLDHLVNIGLILRSTNPDDRRVKRMALTENGIETVEKSMHARHAWVEDLARSLTPAEKSQLLPALKLLLERTDALLDKNHHKLAHPSKGNSEEASTNNHPLVPKG